MHHIPLHPFPLYYIPPILIPSPLHHGSYHGPGILVTVTPQREHPAVTSFSVPSCLPQHAFPTVLHRAESASCHACCHGLWPASASVLSLFSSTIAMGMFWGLVWNKLFMWLKMVLPCPSGQIHPLSAWKETQAVTCPGPLLYGKYPLWILKEDWPWLRAKLLKALILMQLMPFVSRVIESSSGPWGRGCMAGCIFSGTLVLTAQSSEHPYCSHLQAAPHCSAPCPKACPRNSLSM